MRFLITILFTLWFCSFSYAYILKGTGSGVIINDSIVLTNNHVIKDCKYVTVKNNIVNISSEQAIFNYDNNLDIALIKFPKNSFKNSIIFSSSDILNLGSKVYSLGYPGFLRNQIDTVLKYSEGTVSAILDKQGEVIHTAPIYPGSSGSGLFLQNGLFIGLNHAMFNTVQGENLAVQLEYIKTFLSNNNILFTEKIPLFTNYNIVSIEENKDNSVQIYCYIDEPENNNNNLEQVYTFDCEVEGYYDENKNYIGYNQKYYKTIIAYNKYIKVIKSNKEYIFSVFEIKPDEDSLYVFTKPDRIFIFNKKENNNYVIINEMYKINSSIFLQVDSCSLK